MVNRGRLVITTPLDGKTEDEVIEILNNSFPYHAENSADCDYLIRYYKGEQPILNRIKDVRPEINNKIVINNAQLITRTINGYFLGTPIQYVQRSTKSKEALDFYNDILAYIDKSSVDMDLGNMQSICGTSYRIVYTTNDSVLPIGTKSLDPRLTAVVYKADVIGAPVLGYTYYYVESDIPYTMYEVYTKYGYYSIKSPATPLTLLDKSTCEIKFQPYLFDEVPIIEYPNNLWRLGDFEIALDLMNVINSVESDRANDIEQFIQSLITFINCDISKENYEELRAAGVISVTQKGNYTPKIDTLSQSLDHSTTQVYGDSLKDYLYAVVGIPNRSDKASGGDTGTAVELRDGWADLEIVARNKELVFKKSEKRFIMACSKLFENIGFMELIPFDVEIKFSRNKANNLLVKTQSYVNLISSKTLAPEDCLLIVDLVSDTHDYIVRGMEFWGDEFAGKTKTEDVSVNNNEMPENV